MGDIGTIIREVEVEPIPTDAPISEPSPQVQPSEPVKKEMVPA